MPLTPTTGNIKAPVKVNGKQESVSAYLNGKIGSALVSNAISDKNKAARFVTSLITLCSMNPDLQDCDRATLVSAALNAETLGLPLNNQMGFGYVLPYKDKKNNRTVAQFQVGWRGIIQLMLMRSISSSSEMLHMSSEPTAVWISALPTRPSAQPMPIFLFEPPKPPIMWPLKCVSTKSES